MELGNILERALPRTSQRIFRRNASSRKRRASLRIGFAKYPLLRCTLLATALLTTATPGWSAPGAPAAEAPKTVNINTADAATLAEVLKGVGLAKAEAIVAYRKEHGGFKSLEQLSEVKGIGEKLVKANQERIVIK
jgi:competence protein ComEA